MYLASELKLFLDSRDLEIDPNFHCQVEPDDLVEIYDHPSHVQIFCNELFLKSSSYNLEILRARPFSELYWRTPEDHARILNRVADVLQGGRLVQSWNLPEHEVVEMLHPRRRAFKIKMRLIAPIFRRGGQNPVGIATTAQVKTIFEWREDL